MSERMTWPEVIRLAVVASSAFGIGASLWALRSEIKLMRGDICQYAVPETARRFAYSCQEIPSGLQAQEVPR